MGIELRESYFELSLKRNSLDLCVISIFMCSGKIVYREGEIEGNEKKTRRIILRKDSLAFEIGWMEDKDGYRGISYFNNSY